MLPARRRTLNHPPGAVEPSGIAAGPDGNLWFAEPNGGSIGRITPSGTITEFPVPDRVAWLAPPGERETEHQLGSKSDPQTPAYRNDGEPGETYRQDMPIALAYALALLPLVAISGSLVRLARA